MRCLYCGEPLSLLRKLTGKAEFCSEAHREAYQQEFNSLALQRLAAQPKQGKRELSPFPPQVPVETVPEPAPAPAEAFAGLPFPEDSEELELPVFDSPIFTRRPLPTDEAIEPAPLAAFLNADLPRLADVLASVHSVIPELTDYPRPCLLPASTAALALDTNVPYGGYVDLPEPMDQNTEDQSREDVVLAPPQPLHTQSLLGYTLPLTEAVWSVPSDDDLFASPDFEPLPGHTVLQFAPPLAERSVTGAVAQPVLVFARHQAPLAAVANFPQPEPSNCELPAICLPSAAAWLASLDETVAWNAELPPPPERALSAAHVEPMEYRQQEIAHLEQTAPACEPFDVENSLTLLYWPAPELSPTLHSALLAQLTWQPATAGDRDQGGNGVAAGLDTPLGFFVPGALPRLAIGLAPALAPALFATTGIAPLDCPTGEFSPLSWTATMELPRAAAAAVGQWPEAGLMHTQPAVLRAGSAPAPAHARWEHFPLELTLLSPPEGKPVSEWPPVASLASLPVEASLAATGGVNRPTEWLRANVLPQAATLPALGSKTTLARVGVPDFAWPAFAAGCESLFTPDQPFRFHEMPFPPRGTTDLAVGDALTGALMDGLRLGFADDRFDAILRPRSASLDEWLQQQQTVVPPPPPAPSPMPARAPESAAKKPVEAPSSWQQAARAMYEGEQQMPKPLEPSKPGETSKPVEASKPVTAVPVFAEPIKGNEIAVVPPVEPPTPFVRPESLNGRDKNQSPTNEGQGFQWRGDQPHPPPPAAGPSSVSVNTTITVEGSGGSVVVENAVRISLGDRPSKKKGDAIEKFAEGEDIGDSRIQLAPPEGLPDFEGEAPELRAVMEPISPALDSIQWPKFSVTPMRRRIAYGPARGGLFGMGGGQSAPKPAPDAKVLPPKKSVGGFLFKKLTNS
ncbi:MAG: hypothetical protein K2X03_20805 [Bryobacteraceae bacterium]|nr:hypothetical protein [Bryobacteraceae bacterium]